MLLAVAGRATAQGAPDAGPQDPAPPPTASAPTSSAPAAIAPEQPPASTDDSLAALLPDIHAFVSQGYIKSVGNNYLVDSKHGSFAFGEIAVNFTKSLTDRLRMGLQLFAQDLGSQPGNYSVNVDWAYVDYRFKDWFGVRAGRTKLPFGLYNEVNEIDSGRVPVLLPQSVYPLLNRTILLAQTGAELYGYIRLGGLGAIDYRLYGGTINAPAPAVAAPETLQYYSVPYIYGGRVLWETPLEGLRMGGSVQALRVDESVGYPIPNSTQTGSLRVRVPFVLALASVEYAANDLLLAAEYGRWRADEETNFAPTIRQVNERYYGMAAYRVAPWFTPGVYYSVNIPNIDHRSGTNDFQDDLAATLRFDINSHWLFKLEGHYIRGTADLDSGLNSQIPIAQLSRDWAAFFAKTTVYF